MNYYLIIASSAIGGAETRALKILNYLSSERNYNCHLVLNKSLFKAYNDNRFTNFLIKNSNLNIHIVNDKNSIIHDDFLNLLFKDKRFFKFLKFVPSFLLKSLSWYSYLKKLLEQKNSDNIRLHCMHGETARLGTLFLAKEFNFITNFEITSNRHVNEWASQFSKALDSRVYNNIKISCVSKTVRINFTKALLNFKLNLNLLDLDNYDGPFLYFPKLYANYSKEKIIVFGHRLIPTKNPLLLAHVVKELYKEQILNGWRVFFRGAGNLDSEIKMLLQNEIENGQVEVSYTNDLQDDLKKSMIFISLVVTGNFPSNSVFESMNYGNVLLLSDTGITKEKFNCNEVLFCDLNHDSLKTQLIDAVQICNGQLFEKYSNSSKNFYDHLVNENAYINKLNLRLSLC